MDRFCHLRPFRPFSRYFPNAGAGIPKDVKLFFKFAEFFSMNFLRHFKKKSFTITTYIAPNPNTRSGCLGVFFFFFFFFAYEGKQQFIYHRNDESTRTGFVSASSSWRRPRASATRCEAAVSWFVACSGSLVIRGLERNV